METQTRTQHTCRSGNCEHTTEAANRVRDAAPDLLAALEMMVQAHGPMCGNGPCVTAARAAIAKARGQ